MKIKIKNIKPKSIAEELGIEVDDILLSVNNTKIKDILDYKFQISDEFVELEILKQNGEIEEFEIEKEINEDLGIEFENELIDKPRNCANKCIFCFMDQLPKGVRDTLIFKDDDYRLSFFTGNYVTLTNMYEKELERIIQYRLSPINISVHATDTKTRKLMLNNKNAGKILKYIEILTNADLNINIQIDLCKNINDGEILEKTIKDLEKYMPNILSISIVPVGLSRHREGLFKLEPFEKEDYIKVIKQIEPYQKKFKEKYGTTLLYLSDEFYIAGEVELPDYEHYEDFPQIENGVGLTREFINCFEEEYKKTKKIKLEKEKTISLACGKLIYKYTVEMCRKLEEKIEGITINVIPIKNYFFGERITVTGLITGTDLIENLKNKDLGDALYISDIMLKDDTDMFLDDVVVRDLEKELNIKIVRTKNNGKDFVKEIYGRKI